MNHSSLLLAIAALITLGVGFRVWLLTSSKAVRMNTFVGTAGLAFAAYGVAKPGGMQSAVVIAFLVAMIFGGRAAGVMWRSRKDEALRLPSNLMFAIAGTSLLSAVTLILWR